MENTIKTLWWIILGIIDIFLNGCSHSEPMEQPSQQICGQWLIAEEFAMNEDELEISAMGAGNVWAFYPDGKCELGAQSDVYRQCKTYAFDEERMKLYLYGNDGIIIEFNVSGIFSGLEAEMSCLGNLCIVAAKTPIYCVGEDVVFDDGYQRLIFEKIK